VSSNAVVRIPQAERTAATRLRLMEATVDCLVKYGWAGTTTTLIAERAGVSRGAMLHHFPSKLDLVVAAVQHLMERRVDQLHGEFANLPSQGRTRAALDLAAGHFTSPVFFAALELWVAARTDDALRDAVVPLEREVGLQAHRFALDLFEVDESLGSNRAIIQGLLDMLRGLGLAAALSDDSKRRSFILDAWAHILDEQVRPR
jgi:AcrR family transcriptional regulator